jgi:hypothetical protein
MGATLRVDRGSIVRLEAGNDPTWFYCRVDELLSDGELLCSVVEAQSWADLALAGILPGRPIPIPRHRVLSIVRPAG